MVVQPDFVGHWKTNMLEGMLKDYREKHELTLEVLPANLAVILMLRLWAHCQNRKAWIFAEMTPKMLAGVCNWAHDAQWLYDALHECRWVEQEEVDGVASLRVHDWEIINASLVASWERGRFGKMGGRPKKPQETSKVSGDNPEQTSEEPDKRREEKIEPPIVPKGTDKGLSPALLRAFGLFRRRSSTPLDAAELRAWQKKESRGAVEATSEADWKLLEWWFQTSGPDSRYRRKDLATLLNNWNAEIERARIVAHNLGVTISSEKKERAPENWRELLQEEVPEMHLPERFEQLEESARKWVFELAEKKKGAA